jgi:hypothetical protein
MNPGQTSTPQLALTELCHERDWTWAVDPTRGGYIARLFVLGRFGVEATVEAVRPDEQGAVVGLVAALRDLGMDL